METIPVSSARQKISTPASLKRDEHVVEVREGGRGWLEAFLMTDSLESLAVAKERACMGG